VPRTKQQRLVEDRLWELIEPLLPPRPTPKGPGGRPGVDERAALEGILFVLHTGCRWRDLPLQLGHGSGHTAWRRLRAWQAAGVWDRLHRLVLDELSEKPAERLVPRLHRQRLRPRGLRPREGGASSPAETPPTAASPARSTTCSSTRPA
jgi:transposase